MSSKRLIRQIKKIYGDVFPSDQLENLLKDIVMNSDTESLKSFNSTEKFHNFLILIERSYSEDQELLLRSQKNFETSSVELAKTNKDLFKTNKIVDQMINSLDQGFVIFNKSLQCHSIYTKATARMLEEEVDEGRLIQDLLPFEDKNSKDCFINWCELVFSEKFEFDSLVNLAPKRLKDKVSGRILDLEFKTVKDADNSIIFLIAILTDRTIEIEHETKAQKFQEYVQMISMIVSDRFMAFNFIDKIKKMLEDFEKSILVDVAHDDNELLVLKRQLHTIKGAAATCCFFDLANEISVLEFKIRENPNCNDAFQVLRKYTKTLMDIYQDYTQKVDEIFSDRNKSLGEVEKNRSFALTLINRKNDDTLTRDQVLDAIYEEFVLCPIYDLISPYAQRVKEIAKSLGKPEPIFKIFGNNFRINPASLEPFFFQLIHVYTNIVDHALEKENERKALNKPKSGFIKTEVEMLTSENHTRRLKITITDDGRGIDLKKIREKLMGMDNPFKNSGSYSDDELINFIFNDGFSTLDSGSSISGEGVGLSSLKMALEKMKGSVEVYTKINEGTRFLITLPLV